MHIAPYEWAMIGAAVGWLASACCHWLIPKWRYIDIVVMDDDALVRHMLACGAEWVYRHPERRADYERTVSGLRDQLDHE
jgi:hypothetical protein